MRAMSGKINILAISGGRPCRCAGGHPQSRQPNGPSQERLAAPTRLHDGDAGVAEKDKLGLSRPVQACQRRHKSVQYPPSLIRQRSAGMSWSRGIVPTPTAIDIGGTGAITRQSFPHGPMHWMTP